MRVLVLCGGRSAERDISCISAGTILRNLSRRHRKVLVWIDSEGRWWYQRTPDAFAAHPEPYRFHFDRIPASLSFLDPQRGTRLLAGSRRLPVDVVFPVLHGPFGEDGTVQGYLELLGLPYVGCGVLGSAVGMDKGMTKCLALQAGIPVLPYVAIEAGESLAAARKLRLPVFVKPARLGSSVGVSKVKRPSELGPALRRAFRFDTTVLVEKGIEAREIECAVLGGAGRTGASVVGEARPNAEFFSYEAKYLDPNGSEVFIPAKLSQAQMEEVKRLAVRAFETLGCYGLARVDFLLDRRTGRIWFNEVNTMPGFTQGSMYPKLWEFSGLPVPRLLDRLLQLAVLRHRVRARLRITRD